MESPAENSSEKNQFESCDLSDALPAVKTHDLITHVFIDGNAKLSERLSGN
jgi:hypothetical protein